MLRVLQCVNIMDRAGIENMLMNYYKKIDRTQIQFDFLTHRPTKGAYDDEIYKLGGKVYQAPRLYPQNYSYYFSWMSNFFASHPEYKIVHSHIDAMSFFPLLAAKKANIPFRISHSHTSKLDFDVKLPIKFIALKLIPYVSNFYMACGKTAGEFMYGKRDFLVVHNAVDLDKFSFKIGLRDKKRKELGLSDRFVVGHVGRLCYIKNQSFLIDVFRRVLQLKPNAHLLLVGNGEDEKDLLNKIENYNLIGHVHLLKDRDDVDELYQVMDAFVLPSLFEGVPVCGVEAQANGLPCFFSSNISDEILLTNNSVKLDLKDSLEKWAASIVNGCRNTDTDYVKQIMRLSGYDICLEALKLSDFYNTLNY